MKKIICLVGLPGSGKSFVAEIIKKKFKAKVFRTGDIIREEIKRRGLEYSPTADMVIAHWFHTQGREKIVVERAWKKIKNSRQKLIIIDGFRSPNETKYLEEISKIKPIIISITAPFKIRSKREIQRGRFGKEESISYLKKRDKLEKGHGVLKLMRKANYKIDNSKTNANKQIIKLMKKLIKK